MIIELVGPPASGKSTIAYFLETTHGLKRIRVQNRFELLFLNILFFLKYPRKKREWKP
jgi:hypothetical protein